MPESVPVTRSSIDMWMKNSSTLLTERAKVFNCISNRNLHDARESYVCNYVIPIRLIEREMENIEFWVQFGSYYEEHYEITGSHLNEYSKYKTEFSNALCKQGDLKFYNFRLPHIFSESENSARFFSHTIKSQLDRKPVILFARDQVIPIQHISGLINIVKTSTSDSSLATAELIKVPAKIMLSIDDYLECLESFFGYEPQVIVRQRETRTFSALEWPTELTDCGDIRQYIKSIISRYVDFICRSK